MTKILFIFLKPDLIAMKIGLEDFCLIYFYFIFYVLFWVANVTS